MAGWVWVLIAIAVVVALALVAWQGLARRRTARLRERFGPEYERTVGDAGGKREAEAELQARERRREQLEIRPLSSSARDRYVHDWQLVQAQFVDDPHGSVAGADRLIRSVMAERGYPVEDFEQRAADVSVDHPQVVEHYREGHRLAVAGGNGTDATEELRQAMRHYRALFEELVAPAADEPLSREREAVDGEPADRREEQTQDAVGERDGSVRGPAG